MSVSAAHVRRTVHALAATASLAFAPVIPAHAQTVVAGNLGPGQSYLHGTSNSWRVGYDGQLIPPQQFDVAVSFVFNGSQAAELYSFSWAINHFSGADDITASFREGPDIATSTELAAGGWPAIFLNPGADVLIHTIVGRGIFLQPSQTYWISLSLPLPSQSIWGAQWNNTGQTGFWARSWDVSDPDNPVDGGWAQVVHTPNPAFETQTFSISATPEPSSLVLLASGLMLVGGITLRRKLSSRA